MKVSIYGAGRVGVSIAFSLLHTGLVDELVLLDIDKKRAEGEALDLLHATSMFKTCDVKSGNMYDISNSDFIIVTAGRAQKPGESRLELISDNVKIMQSIAKEIIEYSPNSIIINVTNPVDVLTYFLWKFTKLPSKRVIGTGTTLDTARLRVLLSKQVGISPASIHAYVIGEHGDSEFVPFSNATIGGLKLLDYCKQCEVKVGENICLNLQVIEENVRKAAYEIIERKGATNLAIGAVTAQFVSSMWKNEKRVWTPSVLVDEIYIGYPAVVGKDGIEKIIKLDLTETEQQNYLKSRNVIKKVIKEIESTL
jgi:L-lactate dehydrogenase